MLFRVVLKILNLGFYLFWCSPFRPLFVPFGVILSSLICHIARCASRRLDAVRNKSQTSLTFLLSPFTIFVSFFNLQKHTLKKNENQLDIIFRTTLNLKDIPAFISLYFVINLLSVAGFCRVLSGFIRKIKEK